MFFTFLIPAIPVLYAWDGQASLVRTYTFDDVRELIGTEEDPGYHWEIKDGKNEKGKNQGYFIIGTPVNS